MRVQSRTICVTAALVALPPLSLAAGSPTPAGAEADQYEGELKDAWLDGRIETAYALNEHLNPLSIDTRVEDGVVTLSGTVGSEKERELAEALARQTRNVWRVHNNLVVESS